MLVDLSLSLSEMALFSNKHMCWGGGSGGRGVTLV